MSAHALHRVFFEILPVLREVNDGIIKLEVEGKLLDLELSNLGKARLVPKL